MTTINPTDRTQSPGPRNLERSRGRLRAGGLASAAVVLGATVITLGATSSPASAHARCDGVSHNDFHTLALHYDRHAFSRYETSQHYHWWSGSNHTHTHVRFRNTTHGYDYFTANC